MIEIIDNFLEEDEFNKIRDVLMSDNFPWFYNDYITNKNDLSHKFYFTHTFYRQPARISNWFDLWINTLQKLKCNSIIRIKANIYPKNNKEEINKPHIDYKFKHKGCLLYVNDNNGATYFKDKKVIPKANRIVLFDPSIEHSSSLCTNAKRRVTVNFNYF
tara:strand:+ start:86 stop:565 length:480 start_codon:yes stop_codon:yes gene_type:complete